MGEPERHVVFRVDSGRYALPLSAVREVVITPELVTRIPRTGAAVTGVINLRGRVVTVVDLRPLLGLGTPDAPAAKVLLLDRGRRDLGLGVSEVEGIEQLERVVRSATEGMDLVRGVARLGAVQVGVLDVDLLDVRVTALFRGR
ncbi:MAG TPA: chemotaxis protein CheW [Myxococcaceae bacterium]|jgi:purine-binding chemotaxis protein CheW|nr:chemotaxis protein CheW [Myxococcaceae bacterium]